MKRGTPRHPKIYDLMQALDLPIRSRPIVIGYLELLWHFTAEFAPQGDIGKYSDDRIEGAMDWNGKRGKLIEALVKSGWLDRGRAGVRPIRAEAGPKPDPSEPELDRSQPESGQSQLVVHDWHEHADASTLKKLERAGLQFVVVTVKVTDYCPQPLQTTADNIVLPLPLPLPLPEPLPYREPNTDAPDGALFDAKPIKEEKPRAVRGKRTEEQILKALGSRVFWWNEFKREFPCKDDLYRGMDNFERMVTSEEIFAAVLAGAKRYAIKARADPTMKLKYAQGWLTDHRWEDECAVITSEIAPVKSIYTKTEVPKDADWTRVT